MRQLLVAFVAAAALVASQNSAEAVFVKVLIDDFTRPLAGDDGGTPDTSNNGEEQPLGPPNSDVATNRALGPDDQPIGLTVPVGGGSLLGIELDPAYPSGWRIDYTLAASAASFLATDPVVFLTGVTGTGDMTVAMLVDGNLYDTAVFSGDGDLSFYNATAAMNPYDVISFVFTTENGFSGTAESVVANPEPATMALMGLGVLGGAIGYRRRRKDDEVAPVDA